MRCGCESGLLQSIPDGVQDGIPNAGLVVIAGDGRCGAM
jgi:hypothetical protein